ncbi:hypothetical protein [Streptomyces sp. HUAS ZL42]|uniref:hypothetical protein n=1 Tax=Streptomyces sp. HUAS ZL42 TaxID=3231715 RepID=UPI00345EF37C
MATPLTAEGKQRIEGILARAAEDIEFREALLLSPETALSDTELTESERELLATMKRVALEEWGVDVRKFRAFLMDNGYGRGND